MVMRGGIWKVAVPGRVDAPGEGVSVSMRFVTPGYFETMGMPLVAGRDVSDSDTRERRSSRSLASRSPSVWPGQDALGRRFGLACWAARDQAAPLQDRTVVGVAGDVRVRGIERDSEPQVYLPDRQVPDGGVIFYAPKDLAIRSSGTRACSTPAGAAPRGRAGRSAAAGLERADARGRGALRDGARTAQVRVLIGFAAGRAAGRRRHPRPAGLRRAQPLAEIGVRVALGASPRDVLDLVLRQAARLTAAASSLGLALSLCGRPRHAVAAVRREPARRRHVRRGRRARGATACAGCVAPARGPCASTRSR